MYGLKKKNARFGRYPSCDMVNNAIRFLLKDKDKRIILEELSYAIMKADGYFHEDVAKSLQEYMGWKDSPWKKKS